MAGRGETPEGAGGGSDPRVEELLARVSRGEGHAAGELLPLVYDHLRALARAKLAGEGAGQTLQPTALVHEAYLKLLGNERPWNDKRHFFAAAALAMRRILVDRARAKRGEKRGGGKKIFSLDGLEEGPGVEGRGGTSGGAGLEETDWVALEGAMSALEAHDPGLAEVVHLRYYAGLTLEETAKVLGVSSRTINRDWLVARAWLLRRMHPPG